MIPNGRQELKNALGASGDSDLRSCLFAPLAERAAARDCATAPVLFVALPLTEGVACRLSSHLSGRFCPCRLYYCPVDFHAAAGAAQRCDALAAEAGPRCERPEAAAERCDAPAAAEAVWSYWEAD